MHLTHKSAKSLTAPSKHRALSDAGQAETVLSPTQKVTASGQKLKHLADRGDERAGALVQTPHAPPGNRRPATDEPAPPADAGKDPAAAAPPYLLVLLDRLVVL